MSHLPYESIIALDMKYKGTLLAGVLLWGICCVIAGRLWLKRDKWQKILYIFAFMFALMWISARWMAKIESLLFPSGSGISNMRLYGPIFLMPAIMYPVFYLLGLRVTERLDALTVPFYVMVCVAKLACHFGACCYGIPSEWGIENPFVNRTVFPVQIFESASIGLLVILMFLYRNSKFFKRGTLYPLTTLIYALTRFFWEYFREYNGTQANQTDLMWGLNLWQVVSVLAIVLSLIWLILLPKQMRLVIAEEQRGPEVSIFKWDLYKKRWKLGFHRPGTAAFKTLKKEKKINRHLTKL
jgi:prolipoprotein diacylglyceryltransferase